MEEIIRLAAIAILAAVLIDLLDQYNRTYAIIASVSICCGILLYLMNKLKPALLYLKELAALSAAQDFDCILKAVGIAILAQCAADICTDCGQRALAGRVILAGRVAILLVSLPLFARLVQLIGKLLGQ